MPEEKLDLLKGTLDLLVLQILSSMGATHGYGIARRLEQISGDELAMNEGTIYASLVCLQHRRADQGLIDAPVELGGAADTDERAAVLLRVARENLAKTTGINSVAVADGLPLDFRSRVIRVSRQVGVGGVNTFRLGT